MTHFRAATWLLALATLSGSPAALADTDGLFGTPESGVYAGAGWGRFNLHIEDLQDVGTTVSTITHAKDNAWKAFLGSRLNPYIAVEGAYIDFGTPSDRFSATGSDGNYRAKLSGFAPYLIGTAPIGPVELFGKVGYYIYKVDLRAHFDTGALPDIDSSHRRKDFLYGGGVGLTLLGHLAARAEYEVLDAKHAPSSNAFWLSAAWRF